MTMLHSYIFKQNPVLEGINVDFQLHVLQNIWLSAWCLVLPTSSGPKSAWRTKCEIYCIPALFLYVYVCLPGLLFVCFLFGFTLFFFSLIAIITRPLSLCGELNASMFSVCLSSTFFSFVGSLGPFHFFFLLFLKCVDSS